MSPLLCLRRKWQFCLNKCSYSSFLTQPNHTKLHHETLGSDLHWERHIPKVGTETITAKEGGGKHTKNEHECSKLQVGLAVPFRLPGDQTQSLNSSIVSLRPSPDLCVDVNRFCGKQENKAWGRFCKSKPKRSTAKQTPDTCRSILFCPWWFPVYILQEQCPL